MKNILDQIDDFRFRYILLNTHYYRSLCNRLNIEKENIPISIKSIIFDLEKKKIVTYNEESVTKNSIKLSSNNDLSFLNKYETDDKSYLLQISHVNINKNSTIDKIYKIGHVWLGYTLLYSKEIS